MKEYNCPQFLKNERIICLDIETSGLDIQRNTIIQMGIIEVNYGKIVKEYTTLFGGGKSSVFLVRNIHHIKDCDRIGKKTFKERAQKISAYLSNSIIVTHNGNSFDIPMINYKLNECGYQTQNTRYIDTYRIAKSIGQFESNSLQNLSKYFDIKYGEHRGLGDAYSTLQLLYALCEKYGQDFIKMKGKIK